LSGEVAARAERATTADPAAEAGRLAHALHSCLDANELRDCLDRSLAGGGFHGYSILFRNSATGAFFAYLSGGGVGPEALEVGVHLHELLEQGDGRLRPVEPFPLGDARPPVNAAATLSFRGEKYGLLLLHGAQGDIRAWQPVADALRSELVKLQLYQAAGQESATAGTKLAALNEAGELVKFVDLEVLLTKLMELSVRIAQAEVGSIVLAQDDRLYTGVEWGLTEDFLLGLKTPDGGSFLRSVLEKGEPVLVGDTSSSARIDTRSIAQKLRSLVAVPLLTQTDRVGVIVIANPAGDGPNAEGFEVLSTIANLCAAAVQNAQLYQRAMSHQRIEAEMRLAASVQAGLLPDSAPPHAAVEITGWNIPCDETGGDYFDFVDLGEGRTAIVIGDATGHGMGAALMMFIVRSTLRALLTQSSDLESILQTMNDLIEEVSDDHRFMTLFIGVVDARGETLTYATAGHDPPLVHRPGAMGFVELPPTGGVPLGVLPGSRYRVVELRLRPGDVWVFGTDGIWEARDAERRFYGKDRVMSLVRAAAHESIGEISRRLREDVLAFHRGTTRRDDITAVLMKVRPR
jgi:sigma-B regulation protein RsbU (phosphoserine phosphatase)